MASPLALVALLVVRAVTGKMATLGAVTTPNAERPIRVAPYSTWSSRRRRGRLMCLLLSLVLRLLLVLLVGFLLGIFLGLCLRSLVLLRRGRRLGAISFNVPHFSTAVALLAINSVRLRAGLAVVPGLPTIVADPVGGRAFSGQMAEFATYVAATCTNHRVLFLGEGGVKMRFEALGRTSSSWCSFR